MIKRLFQGNDRVKVTNQEGNCQFQHKETMPFVILLMYSIQMLEILNTWKRGKRMLYSGMYVNSILHYGSNPGKHLSTCLTLSLWVVPMTKA